MREVISGAIIGGVIGFMSLFLVSGYGHNLFGNTNYIYTIPKNYHDGIKTDALHSVGIDSTKIIELTELILADSFPNIHSLLIAKDNKLLYENYFGGTDEVYGRQLGYTQHSMGDLHDCRSISKSVTSACIGIAVKNGLIKNVDEPIFSYFKEYEKYFDTIKRKITIRHLLTMTSGFDWNEDVSYRDPQNSELKMDMSTDPIEYILSQPIVAEPGTRWNYNGGGTQLLAEILKIVSGEKVDKFAEKHLFSPLNIQKYEWLTIKKNMPAAASGLRLASRDILKIALLYMNNGSWYETKIFTPEWAQISLSENVKRPSTRTMSGGYGYQFWTYTDTINTKPLKIAEAKGNGGQHIFFCRELNLIVVTTAGNYNQWNVNNNPHKALIQYIIPAIKN